MRTKYYIILAAIITLVIIFGSCTDPKKDLPVAVSGTVKIHDTGWNDPASPNFHGKVLKTKEYNLNTCVACHAKSFNGGTSRVSCATCHISYPHKTGWKADTSSTNFHGKFILSGQGSVDSCASCHGTDYLGGTSGKSCFTCHTLYPHRAAWKSDTASTEFHGKYLITDLAKMDSCMICHGRDFLGGSSGKSCYTCHNAFPHKTGWGSDTSSTNFHGKFILSGQGNVQSCTPCHGADYSGGSTGVSCYDCHASFPHKTGWTTDTSSTNFHGKYILTGQDSIQSCTPCHGADYTGGTSHKSCYTCHSTFPHKTGWTTDTSSANFHGKFILSGQGQMQGCTICHGADYTGGSSSKSCYACHNTYPHKTGWGVDTSSTNFHGKYLVSGQGNVQSCTPCHGTDLNGGTSGVSCNSCHNTYPHKTGWTTDTSSANFHGKFIISGQGDLLSCTSCHGTDYTGGTSGKSCYTCHNTYPHKTGWTIETTSDNFHGKFILTGQGTLQGCTPCHGADYTGGTSGKSCYTCHATYPHKTGWTTDTSSTNFHGKFILTGQGTLQGCTPCHGADYTGGSSGKSCYSCHNSYPHNSSWATDTSSANFHGKFIMSGQGDILSCTSCHGSDYTGGSSGVSCYNCHAAFPHKAGWMTVSSPDYHGRYLKANSWQVNECAPCHGSQFTGGTSGVSCRDCHYTFPHSAGYGSADGHPVYMRTNNFPFDTCKVCHGSSYSGGSIVNVSCLNCHTNTGGPEACNTCHGNFNGTTFLDAAPPKSVNRDTLTTVRGVGAHQNHLVNNILGVQVKCQECHTVPPSMISPGHIDIPFNIQVVFNDSLASLKTSGGTVVPTPAFSSSNLSCSNVYCHGYFKNGNQTNSPTWNVVDGTQAACGTCHGNPVTNVPLPGGTHLQGTPIYNCQTCHTTGSTPVATYNSSNGTWTITDKARHINGKLSRYGNETTF